MNSRYLPYIKYNLIEIIYKGMIILVDIAS